jgi:hypothetical protein
MLVFSVADRQQLHVYRLIDRHNYARVSGSRSVMTASLIVLAVSYDVTVSPQQTSEEGQLPPPK